MKGHDDVFRRQLQSIFVFLFAVFMLVGASQFVEAVDSDYNNRTAFINETGATIKRAYIYHKGSLPGKYAFAESIKDGETCAWWFRQESPVYCMKIDMEDGREFTSTEIDLERTHLIRARVRSDGSIYLQLN